MSVFSAGANRLTQVSVSVPSTGYTFAEWFFPTAAPATGQGPVLDIPGVDWHDVHKKGTAGWSSFANGSSADLQALTTANRAGGYVIGVSWICLATVYDGTPAAPRIYRGYLNEAMAECTYSSRQTSGLGTLSNGTATLYWGSNGASSGAAASRPGHHAVFAYWNRALSLAELRAWQFFQALPTGCQVFCAPVGDERTPVDGSFNKRSISYNTAAVIRPGMGFPLLSAAAQLVADQEWQTVATVTLFTGGAGGAQSITGDGGHGAATGAAGTLAGSGNADLAGAAGSATASGASGTLGASGNADLAGAAGSAQAEGADGTVGPTGSVSLTGAAGTMTAAGADGSVAASGNADLAGAAGHGTATGADGTISSGAGALAGDAGSMTAQGADGTLTPTGSVDLAGAAPSMTAAGADGSIGGTGTADLTGAAGSATAEGADGTISVAGATLAGAAGSMQAEGADGTLAPTGSAPLAGAAGHGTATGAAGALGGSGNVGLTGPAGHGTATGASGALLLVDASVPHFSPADEPIYVAELTVYDPAIPGTRVLRFSTGPFVTSPAASTPNTTYDPRITQPALLRRDVFQQGRTGGGGQIGVGSLTLANPDGLLDGLLDYGVDGRECVIKLGYATDVDMAAFTTVCVVVMEQIEYARNALTVKLRDKQFLLANPVCAATYAGTNALPNGLEGTPDTLGGHRKPRAFGYVFSAPVPMVNTARLIYQLNDGPVVAGQTIVYDAGLALTAGADYTSQADMETNAPAAGAFRVWPAGGYARLGATPAGQVTADMVQGATAADRTAAGIWKALATGPGGLTAGDYVAADLTALDAATSSAPVGLWIDDDTAVRVAMDRVTASVGAWWTPDALGRLRVAQLTAPAGAPVAVLTRDMMVGDAPKRVAPSDVTAGLPVKLVRIGYAPIEQTITDPAGAVTPARRAFLAEPVRYATSDNAAVLTKHPLAPEYAEDTRLALAADAQAEADRRKALHGAERVRLELSVRLDPANAAAIDLGSVVQVTYDRMGLAGGKLFRVIGMQLDARLNKMALTLWG